MMKQKSGSIVFCSSAVAKIGLSNHEAIAAAKVIELIPLQTTFVCAKSL